MSVRSNLKMSAAPAVAPPTEAQPRKMLRLRVKEDEEEAGRDDAQAETEAATTVQLTRDPGTATMVLRGILTPTGKTTVIGNANQAPRSGGSGLQAATLEMRSVMLMLALVLLLAMVMLITRTRRWNGCL
ncbi:unnamed protein product [Vitrella brassicaformis CCMP3155]|uniref:Uncharacterized protein n=2 Tax=Vitrella brassicaformis TaxID=1169539 RepID=A0A0G4EQW3_VITBC|nr:unnamed protein product [Vitrella brassicaformis CCMP3155]|eukprot:CEL99836.1 unnamed protein product [Vitrella brassicaformis CCMP3155]